MWKPMFGSVCKPSSTGRQRFLSPFTYETGSNVPAILLSILGLVDRRQQRAMKLGYVKSWRYLDDWFCISRRAALCNRSHLPSTLRTNVDVNEEKLKALVHSLGRLIISHQWTYSNSIKQSQTRDSSFSTFRQHWQSADSEVSSLPAWFEAMCYRTILTMVAFEAVPEVST